MAAADEKESGDHNIEDVTAADRAEPTIQKKGQSLFNYLMTELSRGYLLERDEAKYTEKRERVYSFMKTPRALETFILYGFLQCVDAFLYLFTFLPLRIFLALLRVLTHPCGILMSGSRKILEQAQICDILKGVIMAACCFILNYIDTSMIYHIVRGQAVIKLYIFYNMLEMADKLFSSFGQDILDALFWTATEPRGKKREHIGVVPHLLLAIIFVFFHSMLTLFQATTLNVAFNSHNKALLTIMMSNNFVEIKGNVFRRMDKKNLFLLSCSDAKERFHLVTLLFLVFIRNMTEFDWSTEHLWVLLPDAGIVLFAEFLVDWFKHAFVTKFNEINSDVYHDFTVSLAYDMSLSRQKYAFTDHSDIVSRRMTFTPLPIACLVIHIVSKSIKISGWTGMGIVLVGYFCLMTFKVLTSIFILGRACDLIQQHKKDNSDRARDEVNTSVKGEKSPKFIIPRSKSFSQPPGGASMEQELLARVAREKKFHVENEPPINSQLLFSSSTVSIDSIALNEEVFEQPLDKLTQTGQGETSSLVGAMEASSKMEYSTSDSDRAVTDFRSMKTSLTKASRTVSLPVQSVPGVIQELDTDDTMSSNVRHRNNSSTQTDTVS